VEIPEGPPYEAALVTVCLITNELRLNAAGEAIEETDLIASQRVELVVPTEYGWLPSEPVSEHVNYPGATACPLE
jgi:hypothetical protein